MSINVSNARVSICKRWGSKRKKLLKSQGSKSIMRNKAKLMSRRKPKKHMKPLQSLKFLTRETKCLRNAQPVEAHSGSEVLSGVKKSTKLTSSIDFIIRANRSHAS